MVKTWRRSLTACLFATCISIVSFTEPVFAQKALTREQVLQDAKVTEDILKKYHPNLNAHRTQAQIEAIWTEAKARLPESPNVLDAATLIQQMLAAVCDDHTGVRSEKDWISKKGEVSGVLPTGLVIIDNQLFVDDSMFNLKLRQVISINGRDSGDIIEIIRSLYSEDGCQNSPYLFTRHSGGQVLLSAVLENFLGGGSEYIVKYRERATGAVKTLGLREVTMGEVQRRARYEGLYGRAAPLKSLGITARNRDWATAIESPMQAMVLTNEQRSAYYVYVPEFSGNKAQPNFFDKQLRDLVRASPDHVIVDLTDNPGGAFNSAQLFLSFFFTNPNQVWSVERSRINRRVLDKNFEWSNRDRREYTFHRITEFQRGKEDANQFYLKVTPRYFGNSAYRGNLTVLVSPRTKSAATTVATILKREAGARIVGSIGDASMTTGCNGAPGRFRLQYSGVGAVVPFFCGDRHVEAQSKGNLLEPDVPVDITTHNSRMTNVLILRAAIDSLGTGRVAQRDNPRQPAEIPGRPVSTERLELEPVEKTIDVTLAVNPYNRNAGWIGFRMADLPKTEFVAGESEAGDAVLITGIFQNSPAEEIGLQPGDILLSVEENKVSNVLDVMDRARKFDPNQKISINILRLARSESRLFKVLESQLAGPDVNAGKAFMLGRLYVTGNYGAPKIREGTRFLEIAADAGHSKAAAVLGDLYSGYRWGVNSNIRRKTVAKNIDRAMVYYTRAAMRGESWAMYRLAQLFGDQGQGHSDPELAALYLLQSYQRNNRSAHKALFETPKRWSKDARIALKKLLHEAGVYDGDFDGEIDADVREALTRLVEKNVALPQGLPG